MRSIVLAISVFVLNLAIQPPGTASAQSGPASPDFDLAYVLATASYCAYTVGQADADNGQARALRCLKAAVRQDNELLDVFSDITQDDVEAYFDSHHPENAYLLVWTKKAGVILAFRGTLTPPISPEGGIFTAATAAIAKAHELELFQTFIADWARNFNFIPSPLNFITNPQDGRHSGFNEAWSGLQAHLVAKDCSKDCSKFLSFVSRLHGTPSLRLYITGHSKGGALATLAAIDLPGLIDGDIISVVYTFSAAKALTVGGANGHAEAVKNIWRFEHQFDIVPSAPPDRTVNPFLPYTHVGGRVFFAQGGLLQSPDWPQGGADSPGDRKRLTEDVQNLLSPGSQFFDFTQLINPAALMASAQRFTKIDCQAFVDNHFVVFADVQGLVHAQHAGAPSTATEKDLNQSFFYTGLRDDGGNILWGYSQWCLELTKP
jgi:hypothetical protein